MYKLIVTHGQNHGLAQALYDHYVSLDDPAILIQLPYRADMIPPFIKCNFKQFVPQKHIICLNGSFFPIRIILQCLIMIFSLLRVFISVGFPEKIYVSNPLNFFCVYLTSPKKIPLRYITIDLSVSSFGKFNNVYVLMDKMACTKSDLILGVSETMNIVRSKLYKISRSKFAVIPIGLVECVSPIDFDLSNSSQSFLYLGSVENKYRIDLVIDALQKIEKLNWTLEIIGDGSALDSLKEYAKRSKNSKNIIFHGNISDRNKLMKIVNQSFIGLCLIDKSLDNFSRFADITKVKEYIGYGIPVICSDNLKKRYDAGMPIIYSKMNKDDLNAIFIELLQNKNNQYSDIKRKIKKTQTKLLWKNILKDNLNV